MKREMNALHKAGAVIIVLLIASLSGCSSKALSQESSLIESSQSSEVQNQNSELESSLAAQQAKIERLQSELEALKASEAEQSESNEATIPDTSSPAETSETEESETEVSKVETVNLSAAISSIAFNKSSDLTLLVGDQNRRSAATTPAGGAVTYSSSDSAVATVSSDGNVICLMAGKTIVSAKSGTKSASYNLTVNAKTAAPSTASGAPATSQSSSAASGTSVFAGYTVTVKDKTTLATTSGGTTWPITTYYFYSSDGSVLGSITGDACLKIQEKNMVKNSRGEWMPPDSKDDWDVWFAKQFNLYRGLSGSTSGTSSSSSAGNANTSKVDIEAFRQEVIRLTNAEREKAGLPALVSTDIAMSYAQTRASEIAVSFSHTRPNDADKEADGLNFIDNIASGQKTPKDVVAGWMNSPGHKATILADYSAYGNITGVGCYQASDGVIYWTQEFVIWDANA